MSLTYLISSNNLRLHHLKSIVIVFVSPRCRRNVVIPSPVVSTIPKVEEIKALGVIISSKFSVVQHVNLVLGMTLNCIHTE